MNTLIKEKLQNVEEQQVAVNLKAKCNSVRLESERRLILSEGLSARKSVGR